MKSCKVCSEYFSPSRPMKKVCSPSARNRDGPLPNMAKQWHGPFDGEFAGTSVSVVMLVANR